MKSRSHRRQAELDFHRDLTEPIRVKAQIRNRHEAADATVSNTEDGNVAVRFDVPQRAITPGQAVVFYDDGVVVGGGWIRESRR